MTTTKTGRAATKTERKETAQAMSDADRTALDLLVKAARESINKSESQGRVAKGHAEKLVIALDSAADYKVYAARTLALLAKHPATLAKGGATKGQPALTTIAKLLGRPATTLETYWKAAKALTAKGWESRVDQPTKAERELVGKPFKDESDRVTVATKARNAGTGEGGNGGNAGAVSVDSLGKRLDAILASVTKFAKDNALTDAERDSLAGKLDAIHDALESAKVPAKVA